ncbi:TerB N-terminal domain-containing protein [Paenibacillus sp. RU5A]|uniref:TerB N-terminal domain-containing protein n=3 Tax=unclassified Paenibacillus TaxID=185978 RepID=UPI0009A63572|nr:TerB N-terminal domain-containing protein [Paenibacillus sp. RU5A]SLJ95549.1 TerB-C domain-containing protein [Paenibacillus sp. RU5A]SOC67307.1 TerB-C domain-containing protein [Paenibacillus sp. RU26A]SOC69327.1 TerB-C domain-containing protein [Paenibacillus sp. RU5M]
MMNMDTLVRIHTQRTVKRNSMKEDSRQLEFMEIDLSEEPITAAVPVPDRSTIVRADFDIRLPGGILSSEKRFVEEARQLIEVEGEQAPFVPFMSYWPTYGVMNEPQRKWYMYWRTEVRQGRFPDTDLSYLFVHIYELINGIGWQEPEEGYDQLKELWINYRERLPQLDVYMQDWIIDYDLVHELNMSLSEMVELSSGYLPPEILDMELQRLLSSNISDISLKLLQRYYDYDITLSKFYRDGGMKVLEQYIPRVMVLVDSYLLRTRKAGILDQFELNHERTIERTLFRKAVYDESIYGKSVQMTYVPIGEHADFVQFVTRVFRCTENKCRELLGFRGRLRGKTLEPELAKVIERYLDKAFAVEQMPVVEQPIVRIDAEKLASLQKESEYVRRALMIEENHTSEDEDANNVSSLPTTVIQNSTEEAESAKQSNQQEVDVEGALNTDGGQENGINEPLSLQWEADFSADLDEEWIQFSEMLSQQHVQAIHALLGVNPDTELMRVAEQYGTMPTLLLDEINDMAMETIGDLLIEGDRMVSDYINVFEHVKR